MTRQLRHLYEFGPFRIDPPERLLTSQGHSIAVTPKAFDVLVILIQRSGRLVEKSQLMEAVWGDSFVEEGNLAVAISTLRKALGDDLGKERRYIQTIAKRGYRFVGDVREVADPEIQSSSPQAVEIAVAAPDPAAQIVTPTRPTSPQIVSRLSQGQFPLILRIIGAALAALALAALVVHLRFHGPNTAEVAVDRREQVLVRKDKIGEATDQSLSPLLSNRAKVRMESLGVENSAADQLYIKGLYFWSKRTVAGLRRSVEYFEQAAVEDPNNPLSYAGLADAYVLLDSYGVESSREEYPSAKAASLKSLQLDSLLPEAHASFGMVLFFDEWNWPQAEQEFRRAIDLDPNYAMAHSWYALDLLALGRTKEAIDQAQIAQKLAPVSLIVNTEVGWAYYSSHQYGSAIDAYQNVLDLDQNFARAHTRLGMVYAAQKNFSNAIREFKKAQDLSGPDPYVDGLLGYSEALSGNTDAARKLLLELTKRSHTEYVPAFSMALICIGLHENDRALSWLTQSFQQRSTYLVYAKTDPLLDSIRSDPRFGALMDQMGLANSLRGQADLVSIKH
jgi:DNA-binding winged helix-turn-helix (wHTH) protein/Flp pilus assembly protein TadD